MPIKTTKKVTNKKVVKEETKPAVEAKKEEVKTAEVKKATKPAVEVKKEEVKSAETKKAPAKKATTKKAAKPAVEAKKEEVKPAETKKAPAKKATTKKALKPAVEAKKEEVKPAETKKATAKKTTKKTTTKKTTTKKVTTKKMTKEEQYAKLSLDTCLDLAKAMSMNVTRDSIIQQLILNPDVKSVSKDLVNKYQLTGKFNFEEDGYDEDLVEVLVSKVYETADIKPQKAEDLQADVDHALNSH